MSQPPMVFGSYRGVYMEFFFKYGRRSRRVAKVKARYQVARASGSKESTVIYPGWRR